MRNTVSVCSLLLGFSAAVTFVGCGYSGSLSSSEVAQGNVQHIVVIFQENVSFDHYFATYPNALNLPGEPVFTALPGTPAVDGLSPDLLLHNPNASNKSNGAGAANPFRLAPVNSSTAHQDHSYN